jgi:hypothetical protein
MKQKSFFAVAIAILAGLSFACNDSTVSPVSPSTENLVNPGNLVEGSSGALRPQTGSGSVNLRVAHLSTDAPPVDVWVNGQVVLSGVPYKAVSDYLSLDSGEYRIQVTPAGATQPVVIDATLALEAGRNYTVAAVGFLSSDSNASTSLMPFVLLDDRSTRSGARIRFVHTSADTGAVDVAVSGGPILFDNMTYQKASLYGEVPGGTYDLEVRPAGSNAVALAIPGFEVADGTTYTVFAVGRSFDGTLEPLAVVDSE